MHFQHYVIFEDALLTGKVGPQVLLQCWHGGKLFTTYVTPER